MQKWFLAIILTAAAVCSFSTLPVSAQEKTAIVDINGQGDYTSLEAALANQERNIWMKAGVYDVSTTLIIRNSGTTLRGESAESVIIRQTNPESDLLAVAGADHVTISNLTLDAETHNAWSALVEADVNYLTVSHMIVRGSARSFAVYFAGPSVSAGEASLQAVENNDLDSSNVFENSVIHSSFYGDALSFSLQKKWSCLRQRAAAGDDRFLPVP